MRVLLISPLPGIDPACGDVTYTQTLLSNPPEGVEYTTYFDAIKQGSLKEHGRRDALQRARLNGRGLGREMLLTGLARGLNFMRQARWFFWEPFRFFSVKPGAFDVVHLHVFSAKFFELDCALVASNAAPQRYLYSDARHYSKLRTDIMETFEIIFGRILGVNLNSYYLPQVARVIAFTEFLQCWYAERNVMRESSIDQVPIYLPSLQRRTVNRRPKRIGFVAKDFLAKGGQTLLRAFEIVRVARPDAELMIVGCEAQLEQSLAARRGISWIPYVPRERLMNEILPSFDVLSYPTNCDGLPLVVLEAMSMGVPVAVSDYLAMPEIVEHGEAGLISPVGDAERLASNILRLLEPETNSHFGCRAWERFEQAYSAGVVRPRLRASYEAAVQQWVGGTRATVQPA